MELNQCSDGGNIYVKINEESENIIVRIKDEGTRYFRKKVIEHIFEPFYSTKVTLGGYYCGSVGYLWNNNISQRMNP